MLLGSFDDLFGRPSLAYFTDVFQPIGFGEGEASSSTRSAIRLDIHSHLRSRGDAPGRCSSAAHRWVSGRDDDDQFDLIRLRHPYSQPKARSDHGRPWLQPRFG